MCRVPSSYNIPTVLPPLNEKTNKIRQVNHNRTTKYRPKEKKKLWPIVLTELQIFLIVYCLEKQQQTTQ